MRKQLAESMSGGAFLIGIALLFLLPGLSFWPGILLVIAGTGALSEFIKGKWADALITLFIMGGLYAWFDGRISIGAGTAIPIALIGIGLLSMLKIFQRRDRIDSVDLETLIDAEWQGSKTKNRYDEFAGDDYEVDEFGVIIDDETFTSDTNILEQR